MTEPADTATQEPTRQERVFGIPDDYHPDRPYVRYPDRHAVFHRFRKLWEPTS